MQRHRGAEEHALYGRRTLTMTLSTSDTLSQNKDLQGSLFNPPLERTSHPSSGPHAILAQSDRQAARFSHLSIQGLSKLGGMLPDW